MKANEIYKVFSEIGATHLHHANSVKTSSTFLEQGGLLSREYVEKNELIQTSQSSDTIDKTLKIWNRIFIDHVDIHARGGRKKGPNQYGPVLFIFELGLLQQMPSKADINVTKLNPIYWPGRGKTECWFSNTKEISENVSYGNFDKMIVIETNDGKLTFPDSSVKIILDDPQRKLKTGEDAFTHAINCLESSAKKGKVKLTLEKRICNTECICKAIYKQYSMDELEKYFG